MHSIALLLQVRRRKFQVGSYTAVGSDPCSETENGSE